MCAIHKEHRKSSFFLFPILKQLGATGSGAIRGGCLVVGGWREGECVWSANKKTGVRGGVGSYEITVGFCWDLRGTPGMGGGYCWEINFEWAEFWKMTYEGGGP